MYLAVAAIAASMATLSHAINQPATVIRTNTSTTHQLHVETQKNKYYSEWEKLKTYIKQEDDNLLWLEGLSVSRTLSPVKLGAASPPQLSSLRHQTPRTLAARHQPPAGEKMICVRMLRTSNKSPTPGGINVIPCRCRCRPYPFTFIEMLAKRKWISQFLTFSSVATIVSKQMKIVCLICFELVCQLKWVQES